MPCLFITLLLLHQASLLDSCYSLIESLRIYYRSTGLYEPHCEKTGLRGFQPCPTQTGLYNQRRWLDA